jgi:NAD(P)-dependent dehydrogenase (short-subunit alcohol dehydrogenase family)
MSALNVGVGRRRVARNEGMRPASGCLRRAGAAVSRRLAGRRALVTGAAGGIGSAIASAFVREGAAVACLGRNSAALDELCLTLESRAVAVPGDVGDPAQAERAVLRAGELLGGLDVLVNAAGIDCDWQPVGELSVESWDETIRINLSGTFYVCRAALPLLVTASESAVVNVTSVAGLRVWEHDSAYAVSKAGVEMLTRTIAVEYARHGVRANCVAPAVIDAGMTDAVTSPAHREALVHLHPLGRMGDADEVAEAAVWLCSGATFTTGWTLAVDGGFLARG